MSRKGLWIALALSLALNVFFVGGAIVTKYQAEDLSAHPEARIEALADRLDLSAGQVEGLKAVREELRAIRDAHRGDRSERRAQILSVIAAEDFDRAALEEILEARRGQRTAMVLEMAEAMHGYLATLEPEQKEAFLDLARQRGFFRRFVGRGEDE